jgi:hypothetical protein
MYDTAVPIPRVGAAIPRRFVDTPSPRLVLEPLSGELVPVCKHDCAYTFPHSKLELAGVDAVSVCVVNSATINEVRLPLSIIPERVHDAQYEEDERMHFRISLHFRISQVRNCLSVETTPSKRQHRAAIQHHARHTASCKARALEWQQKKRHESITEGTGVACGPAQCDSQPNATHVSRFGNV